MGVLNGASSMGEAGRQVELLAAVGGVFRGTRTLGRNCVQCERIWISMAVEIHVGVMSTQLNKTQPSAMGF